MDKSGFDVTENWNDSFVCSIGFFDATLEKFDLFWGQSRAFVNLLLNIIFSVAYLIFTVLYFWGSIFNFWSLIANFVCDRVFSFVNFIRDCIFPPLELT